MNNAYFWRRGLSLLSAAGLLATATAQTTPLPFTAGNYVVVQVGATGGTTALTSAATPVFLNEYTPGGTLVQSRALPTADAGTTLALTASGSATSENNLTRSGDGRYLVLTGYDAAAGTAAVASTAAATTNRVVGRVAANGTINTTTRISDAFDTNNIRSAASADGSSFYAVGGNSGVRYVALGSTGTTTALTPTTAATGTPVNLRYVGVAGGNVYAASASSGTYGLLQVGTGRPTATGQTLTLLPGFATTSGPSNYAFFFADLSAAVAGLDVVYVTEDSSTGGIQKWSLVSGTWTLNGTIGGSATAGLRGLAGSRAGAGVRLAATGSNGFYLVADTTGYNVAPPATLPTAIATAGTNTVFRGVALAPLATALATRPEASQSELALYPSPAQDMLTLALPTGPVAGHQIEVRDLLGRVVLAATLPASGQLRVAGLAAGTYLLTLDGTLTRRFSKTE